jgi:hypothetical protein
MLRALALLVLIVPALAANAEDSSPQWAATLLDLSAGDATVQAQVSGACPSSMLCSAARFVVSERAFDLLVVTTYGGSWSGYHIMTPIGSQEVLATLGDSADPGAVDMNATFQVEKARFGDEARAVVLTTAPHPNIALEVLEHEKVISARTGAQVHGESIKDFTGVEGSLAFQNNGAISVAGVASRTVSGDHGIIGFFWPAQVFGEALDAHIDGPDGTVSCPVTIGDTGIGCDSPLFIFQGPGSATFSMTGKADVVTNPFWEPLAYWVDAPTI